MERLETKQVHAYGNKSMPTAISAKNKKIAESAKLTLSDYQITMQISTKKAAI